MVVIPKNYLGDLRSERVNIIVNFYLIAFNMVIDCFNSLHKKKHVFFESFHFLDDERVKNCAQMLRLRKKDIVPIILCNKKLSHLPGFGSYRKIFFFLDPPNNSTNFTPSWRPVKTCDMACPLKYDANNSNLV